jgi:hypothetical protein
MQTSMLLPLLPLLKAASAPPSGLAAGTCCLPMPGLDLLLQAWAVPLLQLVLSLGSRQLIRCQPRNRRAALPGAALEAAAAVWLLPCP